MKQNTEINLKKADKGSTTVVMDKNDKIREGKIQIDDQNNYRLPAKPMVNEIHGKALSLIKQLHSEISLKIHKSYLFQRKESR